MKILSFFKLLFINLIGISISLNSALACTGLSLKAKDGAYVNGRTVEFATPLKLTGLVIPKNKPFNGTLPDGEMGLQYKAIYAAVGMNAFGQPAILDGMNEKGLAAGAFYFPGYADYTKLTDENKSKAVAPTEFVNWLLTQFATVEEVKNAIDSVVIVPTSQKNWGGVPPFHYIVYDQSGKSIVIEPLKGKLIVYDNPIGVITNSPTFDWHITNLSNYINLSPFNIPSKTIDSYKLSEFGQGNGLRGMPGDFTPPSRFVRATIFATTAITKDTAEETVFDAFHILNQFDIPVGAVRGEANGKQSDDRTIVTTVKDGKNLKFYFKTYEDQSIKVIDLKAFKDNTDMKLMVIPMEESQSVENVTKAARPMQSN